jgi:hypothetical protein
VSTAAPPALSPNTPDAALKAAKLPGKPVNVAALLLELRSLGALYMPALGLGPSLAAPLLAPPLCGGGVGDSGSGGFGGDMPSFVRVEVKFFIRSGDAASKLYRSNGKNAFS